MRRHLAVATISLLASALVLAGATSPVSAQDEEPQQPIWTYFSQSGGTQANLIGGAGNDSLNGGDGDDNIRGVQGTDTIDGGPGTDTCSGESRVNCNP